MNKDYLLKRITLQMKGEQNMDKATSNTKLTDEQIITRTPKTV